MLKRSSEAVWFLFRRTPQNAYVSFVDIMFFLIYRSYSFNQHLDRTSHVPHHITFQKIYMYNDGTPVEHAHGPVIVLLALYDIGHACRQRNMHKAAVLFNPWLWSIMALYSQSVLNLGYKLAAE